MLDCPCCGKESINLYVIKFCDFVLTNRLVPWWVPTGYALFNEETTPPKKDRHVQGFIAADCDLFTAQNAPDVAWPPLLDWLQDHR